jgi:hypothetical protein
MNIKQWFLQGSENDNYYLSLSIKDRYFYQIGQKLFFSSFYNKYNLNSFTENKVGKEYVNGVISRGKWLRKNHPFRSHILNIIDFIFTIHKMIGTGPDPASRIIVKRIIKFFS